MSSARIVCGMFTAINAVSLTKIEKGAFTLCPLKTVVLSRQTTVEEGAFPSTCEIHIEKNEVNT